MSSNDIPDDFICPISLEIMTKPYMHNCGKNMEYENIKTMMEMGSTTCPNCRENIIIGTNFNPNRALKSLIEKYNIDMQTIPIHKKIRNTIQSKLLDIKLERTNINGIITLSTPSYIERQPIHIVCVIDISGSMNDRVGIRNEQGSYESNGFNRLDLAKHALNTFVNALSPGDSFSLIKFASSASIVTENTHIDVYNKEHISESINSLQPTDTTNIWDSLRVAFELIERNHNTSNPMNVAIVLLTDGQPSIDPPMGYEKALLAVERRHAIITGNSFLCSINTLGFSNDIKSDLLYQIANIGGGTYNFIPDAGFIGTICVNLIANLRMTYVTGAKLVYNFHNGTTKQVNLGIIQYQHNRTEIISICDSEAINIASIHLHHNFMESIYDLKNPINWNIIDNNPILQTRYIFIKSLNDSINHKNYAQISQFISLAYITKEINPCAASNQYFNALIDEACGEIKLALDRKYINIWGLHYLRSLIMAHKMQLRNNFKDIAIQYYGNTHELELLRTEINDIFDALPPPKPSLNIENKYQLPTMASYNMQSNGCFAHSSIVMATSDPELNIPHPIQVSKLRIGDYIATTSKSDDKYAQVTHITITPGKNEYPFQAVLFPSSGLIITPWHPVNIDGKWQFPANIVNENPDIAQFIQYNEDVYNIVLKDAKFAYIQGMKVITLAHGIIDDPVAAHPYFGSRHIVDDLDYLQDDEYGRIILDSSYIRRDPYTNMILQYSNY